VVPIVLKPILLNISNKAARKFPSLRSIFPLNVPLELSGSVAVSKDAVNDSGGCRFWCLSRLEKA
jgi:hypothetical protein